MGEFGERIDKAKRRHRPKLSDWRRDGFATVRAGEVERLAQIEESESSSIRVVDALSPAEFRTLEASSTPVVVRGVPARERWAAWDWDLETFRVPLRFKCGEDDDGRSVKLSGSDFVRYAESTDDDSPLYVFDASFAERSEVLGTAFAPPSFLPEDLLDLAGEKRRPPYRWLLVGPKRSGTWVHVDPLGTSAWNTVLRGRKRWVLFEPGTSKHVVEGRGLRAGDDQPVNYFCDILPKIRVAYPAARRLEFIQHPGDTVFIPGGWWHAVLNLDLTLALTQNFASAANFDSVWIKTRLSRKKMAARWLDNLDDRHPDLVHRATRLLDLPPLARRHPRNPSLDRKRARRRGGDPAAAALVPVTPDSPSPPPPPPPPTPVPASPPRDDAVRQQHPFGS
ncbi:hypothetical protein CTAYLR_005622 [Chrysophaeum taylorii]|uniref:JmjC domain-containing protein n=1 Tax=Chrysophaeum taylorii TaxID=2483200 RepID=A0AAD7U8J0_9STRA|nr:hypothetical protein CTAYLR_005622 [Chrysophaeum taylorii]